MKKGLLGTAAAALLSGALVAFGAMPGVALAATPRTLTDFANLVAKLLNNATVDLIVFALVVYFWGITSSMFKGEKGRERLREQLLWGVLIIFLAVSIFGVVQLLQSSFFGSPTAGGSSSSGGQTCTSLQGCQFGTE